MEGNPQVSNVRDRVTGGDVLWDNEYKSRSMY